MGDTVVSQDFSAMAEYDQLLVDLLGPEALTFESSNALTQPNVHLNPPVDAEALLNDDALLQDDPLLAEAISPLAAAPSQQPPQDVSLERYRRRRTNNNRAARASRLKQ